MLIKHDSKLLDALDVLGLIVDMGKKKKLLLWDRMMQAFLSVPLSLHQSLRGSSTHVIALQCNLLRFQLKAFFDGLHLSTSP